ncbi:hypothetical protein [Bradyrhizobium cosmicum]|uniref:hypothetical protein n=1 Tax=Bradyrhizobium cosmicum TaxID=1404864 RepID=UPI0005A0B9F0|nr:hypothetical protein [Bradyrhizobium cosmicum]
MPKKPRKGSTEQERMVAAFSSQSISARNTFHPNLWKKAKKEPADMFIVIGRAAILVNMTQGGSYFQDLYTHNISQARDRIADWAGGLSIKGSNAWRDFDVRWNDIDFIGIISVVQGRHAACCKHETTKYALNQKVRLCASLTNRVMFQLANFGGGARDLLRYCASLPPEDSALAPSPAVGRLIWQHASLLAPFVYFAQHPKIRMGTNGSPSSVFTHVMRVTMSARSKGDYNSNEIFSDLDWNDLAWAAIFATTCLAQMEDAPTGQIRYKILGLPDLRFAVIVSTSSGSLAKNAGQLIERAKADGAKITLIFMLDRSLGMTALLVGFHGQVATSVTNFLRGL